MDEEKGRQYLSRQNTDCLKGLCAIGVLIHHLYQRTGIGVEIYLGAVLWPLGYLMVAVFFFISGYGLMYSYERKGRRYIKEFPVKRIFPFYCTCCFWIFLYGIFHFLIMDDLSIYDVIQSFIFGKTIVIHGWYLQAILIMYLLFYLVFRCINEKYCLLAIAIGIFFYGFFCNAIGLTTTWYESTWCFLLGICWGKYREKIWKQIAHIFDKKRYLFVTAAFFLIFAIFLAAGNTALLPGERIRIFCKELSAVVFVIFICLLLVKIPIDFSITRWLGKYSLEIYLCQGMFLTLFEGKLFDIKNAGIYCLVVIIAVVVSSIIIHPITKIINSKAIMIAGRHLRKEEE